MIQAEAGKTRGATLIGNASQFKSGEGMRMKWGGRSSFILNGIMATVAFAASAASLYLLFNRPHSTDKQIQEFEEELRQFRQEVSESKQDVSEFRQEFRDALKTILAGYGLRYQNERKVPEELPTTSMFQSVFSSMNDKEH